MNLTDKQWELLEVLVSSHESNNDAEFYFACNVGGCGITYAGGRPVPGVYDETDLLQLRSDGLVILVRPSPNVHRGKPTQLGITKAHRRLDRRSLRTLTPVSVEPVGLERSAKKYEEKYPLLGQKAREQLRKHRSQRDKQLREEIEFAEARLRELRESLGRATDEPGRHALEAALNQEMIEFGGKLLGAAATAAADGVREFASGLLLSQNRLGVHADLLREYTARLITELRALLRASEVYRTIPDSPWCEDPIAQKAIRTCEEILHERWTIGDGRPYGGAKKSNGISLSWPTVVEEWEAFKEAEKIESGQHERVPESRLRIILSGHYRTNPEEVTSDQISQAAEDMARHYGSVLIIPLELETSEPPKPAPESKATAQFWKEREDEFREHNTQENCDLTAQWYSETDGWEFRGSTAPGFDLRASEQIFKGLARVAAMGLFGPRSTEPWVDWVDALRRAKDKSTGRLLYSKLSTTGSSTIGARYLERMEKLGESIPPRSLVEFVAWSDGNDRSNAASSPEDGGIEKRLFWDSTSEKIERLFKSSADFCLELRSLAPQSESIAAEMTKEPADKGAVGFVPEASDESNPKPRRRGPTPDRETASRVVEIVNRLAPDTNWRAKLDEICEALDEAGILPPRTWLKNEPKERAWSDCLDRPRVVKAIEYRLATSRKKTTSETSS